MKKIALLLALILVMTTALAGCGGGGSSTTDETTVMAVCVGPNPDTIDPALNSSVDGATLVIHGFEGLYTLDKDGVPIPGQAESVEVSDDGLTYTFTLRENAMWSDGVPVVAEDFVYSWGRAISPDTAADYEYMYDVVKGYDDGNLAVTAIDEKTLQVVLNAATPYFLELTAFPTFAPVRKDIIEANGESWALAPETYIGNGPYKMTEWVSSSHMLYVKNENYWNFDALGPDTIKFVLIEDDNAQLAAFKSGELSFIDSLPQDEIEANIDNPEYHVEGQLGTYYISFNVTKKPLDNPLVRKALALAIDREYICINIGKAGQIPAGGFVPIGISDSDATVEFRVNGGDYYDPSTSAYESNLEAAKAALAEAGFPEGAGLPVLEYIHNEGTGHQQVAEALQDMWAKIGVKVEIVSQEWSTFLNTRKNGEYQIARNGWLADYNDPISFLDMWITGGGNNDAQWSNKNYDALIKSVKNDQSLTKEQRFEKMHEAENIIFDEWMLSPVYYYTDIFMIKTNVEGFYASPLGYKYFMYSSVK